MEQISYRRRNIGPLTRYGRFSGRVTRPRYYTRGRMRPGMFASPRPLPFRKGSVSGYSQNILRVKKIVTDAFSFPPSGGSGASAFYARKFELSDVADNANYTDIYDAYRIYGIQVKLIPRLVVDSVDDRSLLVTSNKTLYIRPDYDDASVPTTLDSMKGAGQTKVFTFGQPFKMWLKPRVAEAVYKGIASTGYKVAEGGRAGPWLDVVSPDVDYYGLKMASSPQALTIPDAQYVIDIVYTYYIEFRGQR